MIMYLFDYCINETVEIDTYDIIGTMESADDGRVFLVNGDGLIFDVDDTEFIRGWFEPLIQALEHEIDNANDKNELYFATYDVMTMYEYHLTQEEYTTLMTRASVRNMEIAAKEVVG